MGIGPKVNVIARLVFEHAKYDAIVQLVCPSATQSVLFPVEQNSY